MDPLTEADEVGLGEAARAPHSHTHDLEADIYDEAARVLAQHPNLDPKAEEYLKVRGLVMVWRDAEGFEEDLRQDQG